MTASEKPPALEPELVHEFVLKSHGDLETVKRLLDEASALVNCAWDWGGGDWETGLGAASHVGRRDIALFLLDHGARMDIFAAAMLGETEIVQAMLASTPGARDAVGPHGIPLVKHAEAGGEQAAEVFALLQHAEATA
jgi:hypothetical protein